MIDSSTAGYADDWQQKQEAKRKQREHYDGMVKKYGRLRATRYAWLGGEPRPKGVDPLQEKEKPLPGYVTSIIYVLSFAAGIVSGSVDLVTMGKAVKDKDWFGAFISFAMFGVLLLIVYGIDKSLARTLPRLKLLFKRGDIFVAVESCLFIAAVGAVEIGTLFTLLQHESDIGTILQGKPLIDPKSQLATIFEGGRAVMAFWTLFHAYLINEDLPPTLSTAKNEGAKLFGGILMLLIQHAQLVKGLKPGDVMDNFILFLSPEPKAEWRMPWATKRDDKGQVIPYDRRVEQITLDQEHSKKLVTALDKLYPDGIPESISLMLAEIEGVQLQRSTNESTSSATGKGGPEKAPFRAPEKPAKGASQNGPDPSSFDKDSDYSRYVLPDGIMLTSTLPLAQMADLFGLGAGTLSEAFNVNGMRPYDPMKGQPKNTKNVQAWQVLALAECKKITLASKYVREEEPALT